MEAREGPAAKSQHDETLDVWEVLGSAGLQQRLVTYGRGGVIFRQGDACDSVMYIQTGLVKISVVSKTGRQAVVAMLGPGDFFGVGGLAGQPVRMETATATATGGTAILVVDQIAMVRLLHEQHAVSDMLIAHLLMRTIQIEEDLIDQLFSSSEKRLARKLLMLARYKERDKSARAVPAISQETLAEMVGTTRSRVNFFLRKFERLGFIDYKNGKNGLRVHDSLLTVVLQDYHARHSEQARSRCVCNRLEAEPEVTAPRDSAMRQLALQALMQRAGAGAETRALADAAQHAYADLVRVSTPLIGKVAVDALTGRALYLAQQNYPWLAATRDAREWSGPFAHVVFCLEQQDPAVATEASAAIFATLIELLVTFIGQPLTASLLREAWPEAFTDEQTRRHKA